MTGCSVELSVSYQHPESTPSKSKVQPHLGCHFGRRFARVCSDPGTWCNLQNSKARLSSALAQLSSAPAPQQHRACPAARTALLTVSAAQPWLVAPCSPVSPPCFYVPRSLGWQLVTPHWGGVSPRPAQLCPPPPWPPSCCPPLSCVRPLLNQEKVRERFPSG